MKLPAHYYDLLQAKAEELGGVGQGTDMTYVDGRGYVPCCIYGIANNIDPTGELAGLLREGWITRSRNDEAVRLHPKSQFVNGACRTPWEEYVKHKLIQLERA